MAVNRASTSKLQTRNHSSITGATKMVAQNTQNIQEVGKSFADLDLETRVRAALAIRLGPTLARLSVEARTGRVTLRGKVLSFYEKQLSNACALRVPGVSALIDSVEVIPSPKNGA
jgi:osmotically-inducible protein OsmY